MDKESEQYLCAHGHLLPFKTSSKQRCPICKAEYDKAWYRNNPGYSKKRYASRSEQQIEKDKGRRKDQVREGKRIPEYAKRKGMSVSEYLVWRENKRLKYEFSEQQKAIKEEIRNSNADAHVKLYKKSARYTSAIERAKYWKNPDKHRERKRDQGKRLTNAYVAAKFSTTVAETPLPILGVYRQIIITRRILRDVRQH
jgi:hypothetical protein